MHMQSALDIDAMRLVTLRLSNYDGFDPTSFLSIFDPFDGMVWLTTIGMFFMGAIFMWITEGDRENDDYKHTHRCCSLQNAGNFLVVFNGFLYLFTTAETPSGCFLCD